MLHLTVENCVERGYYTRGWVLSNVNDGLTVVGNPVENNSYLL